MNDVNDRKEYDRLEDFGRMKIHHHEAPHGGREDPDGLFKKIFFQGYFDAYVHIRETKKRLD